MPRHTREVDLNEEAERLDNKLDRLASDLNDVDDDSDKAAEIIQEAQTLEQHLVGVEWARNPPEEEDRDAYESVTVGALTTGEYGRFTDKVSDVQQEKVGFQQGGSSVNGASQVFFVASGLVEGAGVEEGDTFESKVSVVNQHAPQFTNWLEEQVDDVTTPDTNFRSFADRLQDSGDEKQ